MNQHLRKIETGYSQQSVSSCRFCQNYTQLKANTGFCHKLNAPVVGKWKSCRLAVPLFAASWESEEKKGISRIKSFVVKELG